QIRGMRRLWTVLALVLVTAQDARADLASGRDKLIAGDYKTAIVELGKVTGKDRPAARVLLAYAQLAVGDYTGAEATAAPLALAKGLEAHLILDDVRRATGRMGDARQDLEQLYKDH